MTRVSRVTSLFQMSVIQALGHPSSMTWAPRLLALESLLSFRLWLALRLLRNAGGASLVEPVPVHAPAGRTHVRGGRYGARARRSRPPLPAHAHALCRALRGADP